MTRPPGETPLWTPTADRIEAARITEFARAAEARTGRQLSTYQALHEFSVRDRAGFWSLVWDQCGVIGDKGEALVTDPDRMPGARFFPGARLNYAENLLRESGGGPAIIFQSETGAERTLSWDALRDLVARMVTAYRARGIGPGDRVAAMLPNLPEAVAAMLAAAAVGAVWCSCSPDFGVRGVLDRFAQIEPKLLFVPDGYFYNGKWHDVTERAETVAAELSALATVVVPYDGATPRGGPDGALSLAEFIAAPPAGPSQFERFGFAHPLAILFTSGTTGLPKCIVHSAGGTLLQHLKEHQLHCDIRAGDRVFYFTTLGWMMWNWLVSALASGATICLYDGSPAHPDLDVLFDFADRVDMTLFGTSAKFIDSLHNRHIHPAETHRLASLRTITSTGSPLSADGFRFVYEHIKADVHLASISGGTDICSCFVLGVPTLPVFAGEIQAPGLGMAVDVFSEAGTPLAAGKGELVCTAPFPSMPVKFWADPDGARYRAAYFERFEGVWCHGDFAEWTRHGGIVIHGRSDATLNPGGVRIGTAEIYAQVEKLEEVEEAVCVGRPTGGDVQVVLFVRLAQGAALDKALADRIRAAIRTGASPRHVPSEIYAVTDIPRTRSGKISELAVRDVVAGEPVSNTESLANPEALDQFRQSGSQGV
jgi:acetoacetyl-CoA synthetase